MESLANGVKGLGTFLKRSPTARSILAGQFPFAENTKGRVERTKSPFRARDFSIAEFSPPTDSEIPNPFSDYLADDAKVWSMYLDLTKSKGEELMRVWNSDLDTILIFAGLFSAILTAFLIETRKGLQQDSQVITNQLLQQVVFHLQNPAVPTNTTQPTSVTPFTPSSAILWVNGLWFVSLTFSLTGAFGIILAKGWVSQFIPVSAGLPLLDACNRHRRFFGDDQRHLRTVISALPITLHVGFYLFFGGLVILLFGDDNRIGVVVAVLVAITMLLYLGCSMRPILNSNSPFRTPISNILPVIPGILLPLVLICDGVGHLWFSPPDRYLKSRRPVRITTYSKSEALCLYITDMRRHWIRSIANTVKVLYNLILVSQQPEPSDELRTDVLVSLFALARSQPQNLEAPVCALAALPLTPHLQEALYNTDPLPSLTRNLAEVLSDPSHVQNSTVAQAYLTVLLSLVQTTYSSLNWTASTVMPLFEPGGSLSTWESYSGEILELIVCIHVHVYVRSGFLLPQNLISMISAIISNCTNPFHHRLLVEACLLLSVMDKGATLEKLILDDDTRMTILDFNLELFFSHMIRHPQKRVQKAALSAISGLCSHETSCAALIEQHIIDLLLYEIWGSDPQWQSEALAIFPAFISPGKNAAINLEEDTYNHLIISPWIHSIYNLFLAALLKSEQLNVQKAAVEVLCSYFDYEYARSEFLRLNYIDSLLGMLENGDEVLQIAVLKLLRRLLLYVDIRKSLDQDQFGQVIASTLKITSPHIKENILDFVLYCLDFDDLRFSLVLELEKPLIGLLTLKGDFPNKIILILYAISCNESICGFLLSPAFLSYFFDILTPPDDYLYPLPPTNLAYHTLINILKYNINSSTFLNATLEYSEKPSIGAGLICTIGDLLRKNDASSQILALNILHHCLHYKDLHEILYNSHIVALLITKLDGEYQNIKQQTLNILFQITTSNYYSHAKWQSLITEPLLSIIMQSQTGLSEPALTLLKVCLRQTNNLATFLPSNISDTCLKLLKRNHTHSVLAALMIISECIRYPHIELFAEVFSVPLVENITLIFCSTYQLDVQEKVASLLFEITHQSQLCSILISKSFFSQLLDASLTGDSLFQSLALEIILSLAKLDQTISLLLNDEFFKKLVNLLDGSESNHQIMVLKLFSYLLPYETIHDEFISNNILQKSLAIAQSPNIAIGQAALSCLDYFLTYDNLRATIDTLEFMHIVVFMLHSPYVQCHPAIYQTFLTFVAYDDTHSKLLDPQIVTFVFENQHQSMWPNPDTQKYLANILQTIQELNPSMFQTIIQDHILPVAPLDSSTSFQDDFPERSGHYIFSDADSVLLPAEMKK